MQFETKTVRSGQRAEPLTGAVGLPIFQTATYALEEVGKDNGFDYSRGGTPAGRRLEEARACRPRSAAPSASPTAW